MFIPGYVSFILDRLSANGAEGFLVGGCVRDALMGKTPSDFDIAVSCVPEETVRIFGDCRVIETGLKHGTVTVVSEGHNIELTTFREDGSYGDNRRPDSVSFNCSLENDLSRRDFTVNAMAYNSERGLVDLFGGREDLKNRILRAVGEPGKRFDEDALRIMRALRFSSVLGFEIEKNTAQAVRDKKGLLANISAERKFSELKKLLCGENSFSVLTEYRDVLEQVIPRLDTVNGEDYIKCAAVSAGLKKPAQAFAALIYPLGCAAAEDVCRTLKTDNAFSRNAAFYIRFRDKIFDGRGEALRFAGVYGDTAVGELIGFREAFGISGNSFLEFAAGEKNACKKISDLAVSGADLARIGISGRELGAALERLWIRVTDGCAENTKQALIEEARAFMRGAEK